MPKMIQMGHCYFHKLYILHPEIEGTPYAFIIENFLFMYAECLRYKLSTANALWIRYWAGSDQWKLYCNIQYNRIDNILEFPGWSSRDNNFYWEFKIVLLGNPCIMEINLREESLQYGNQLVTAAMCDVACMQCWNLRSFCLAFTSRLLDWETARVFIQEVFLREFPRILK